MAVLLKFDVKTKAIKYSSISLVSSAVLTAVMTSRLFLFLLVEEQMCGSVYMTRLQN